MTDHNYCIILAGGVGTRFWPMSREAKPKQFLTVNNSGKSLLQQTYARMKRVIAPENILVATQSKYNELVQEQLPELPQENIILEPYNKNTAPTVRYASQLLLDKDPDAVTLVTPSDHIISDLHLFEEAIKTAMEYAASHNVLMTLGVVPTRTETNFGYIQVSGGPSAKEAGVPIKAKTFTEKPDAELAKVFVESGEFLWNSGIFIWKASTIIEEIGNCCPEIEDAWKSGDLERFYSLTPRISIDYAVMEKSDKVWILPAKFHWNDVGTWNTFYEHHLRHSKGDNVCEIAGPTILKDNKGDIFYSDQNRKLMVIRGLEDFIVVNTDDVLLICPRDDRTLQDTISELNLPELGEYR